MATENILMACVEAGGDRQELHEAIRSHSMDASREVKLKGKPNDLLTRIAKDERFKAIHPKLKELVDPTLFIGRCPQQVGKEMFFYPFTFFFGSFFCLVSFILSLFSWVFFSVLVASPPEISLSFD